MTPTKLLAPCLLALAAAGATTHWAAAADAKSAATADPLANYYTSTLICEDQTTKAQCRLWLNPDGKYFAFYNLGPQSKVPDINGPFQVEGREGTYTLRDDGGVYQLCLWVAAPRIRIGAEVAGEMYSEAACYPFAPHKAGDAWNDKDLVGRDTKFWLMKGR